MASSDYEEENLEAHFNKNQSKSSARKSAFNLNHSIRDLKSQKENGTDFEEK